ncbi:endo-1,4-beta-xylanase [Nocardiopsis terrae]|uniref:Beta-xylanase n=1 Tax=Nocardiopsis terrae TaxID=372655 RepID=A0ABR9HHL8_9ACTN|nr:endo-1,4-beta-xylanase [Nocardiopsis terrae]MBE1458526.1 endo-1,4-beta-xylanase [Nocardiopsis terrae]
MREAVRNGWRSATRGRGVLLSAGAVCVVIFLVVAIVVLVLPGPGEEPGSELPALAEAHGIELGVAVAVNPLTHDPGYQDLVTDHYTSVTAENTMKWQYVQPERYEFDWGGPDAVVDFAEDNGLSVRGHTLLWHNQQPDWLARGSFDAGELRTVMREHTEALLGRYEGRIGSWDVINEPFEDDTPELRENLWLQTLGEDYIAEALRTAHEVDPQAKLYINEFGVEGGGEKADALYALASDLLEQGAPLHGIGFQGHFVHGNVPPDLAENMQRFADLGLDVEISELDVRIPEPVGEEQLAEQAEEYQYVIESCLAVSRCVGVSVWGVADSHSWIPEWFPGYTAALPFDEDYAPKPALGGMVEALSRGRRTQSRGGPSRTAPRQERRRPAG